MDELAAKVRRKEQPPIDDRSAVENLEEKLRRRQEKNDL
jgi:hypothetical protein